MPLLWMGFLGTQLGGAVRFAPIEVDRTLVAAATLGTVGAFAVVLAGTRPILFASAVPLGLGTECPLPGVPGQLVDFDPSRGAAVTGMALALMAIAGLVPPLALGAPADAVGTPNAGVRAVRHGGDDARGADRRRAPAGPSDS